MTTYRYYVKCANPADFVSSVSGDTNNPTVVETTGEYYQNELGGGTPNGISPFLYGSFPDLQYDSWGHHRSHFRARCWDWRSCCIDRSRHGKPLVDQLRSWIWHSR